MAVTLYRQVRFTRAQFEKMARRVVRKGTPPSRAP